MPRRSQMEIYMDIVGAVTDGLERPTHVMYRANLSWTRLNRHSESLVRQGFLQKNPAEGAIVFSVTQKGKEVLAYYRKIEEELYPRKRTLSTRVPYTWSSSVQE